MGILKEITCLNEEIKNPTIRTTDENIFGLQLGTHHRRFTKKNPDSSLRSTLLPCSYTLENEILTYMFSHEQAKRETFTFKVHSKSLLFTFTKIRVSR